MAGLVAAVAIMLITSAVAFQAWTDMLRRENEAEMIFRAQEIVRAIQRYRRDHGGAGPDALEKLMEPGPKGQYYLRRLYEDPLVPDGKWGLLYAGPGGQVIDPNAVNQGGDLFGGSGGGLSKGGRGRGGLQQGGLQQGGLQQGGLQQGGLQQQGGQGQIGGLGGQMGQGIGGQGQIGGMLIAGVRTLCEEKPFRVYNGLTEYNEWLFTYLDLEQRQRQRGTQPRQGIDAPSQSAISNQRPGFGNRPPTQQLGGR